MINEVIADIDADAAEIVLLIHWMGGVHTELRLPRRRRRQGNSTSPDIINAVRQLVLIANDDLIARILKAGLLWHRSLGFLWSQVQSLVLLVFQVKGPYLPAFGARSSAVEHLTFNQVVVGSIPTGLTNKFRHIALFPVPRK